MWTYYLLSCLILFCMSSVNCEECDEGAIRLSNGDTDLNRRMQVCIENVWGTVCADGWDTRNTRVVCRQLGRSIEATGLIQFCIPLGHMEGSGPIHLSRVYCTGFETRLVDCPSLNADINCDSGNDVGGIRCRPSALNITSTDTSVMVRWQEQSNPLSQPRAYNITISAYSGDIDTAVISVTSTDTYVEYNQLIPQQQYRCCVIAIPSTQPTLFTSTSIGCDDFQTKPSPTTTTSKPASNPSTSTNPTHPYTTTSKSTAHPSTSTNSTQPNTTPSKSTAHPNPNTRSDSLNSNSTPIVGGVLGFVIAVLVLLLVVAGYLQCVRSRGKDNSRSAHMSTNPAYGQQPQQPSEGEDRYAAATGGGEIPSYETIRGPTTSSHVTANIMAQHYEMQGPVHYDVLEANGPATKCQDYEVPQETEGRDEADKDDYSHLHHK